MTGLAVALGVFLTAVGVSHFFAVDYYERLVPPWLPGKRPLVLASGAVEIALGIGLVAGTTRQIAAVGATVLMGIYVLTHVDALVRSEFQADRWLDRPSGAVVRVLVNVVYLALAAAVAITT